jgi:hypothetical protein
MGSRSSTIVSIFTLTDIATAILLCNLIVLFTIISRLCSLALSPSHLHSHSVIDCYKRMEEARLFDEDAEFGLWRVEGIENVEAELVKSDPDPHIFPLIFRLHCYADNRDRHKSSLSSTPSFSSSTSTSTFHRFYHNVPLTHLVAPLGADAMYADYTWNVHHYKVYADTVKQEMEKENKEKEIERKYDIVDPSTLPFLLSVVGSRTDSPVISLALPSVFGTKLCAFLGSEKSHYTVPGLMYQLPLCSSPLLQPSAVFIPALQSKADANVNWVIGDKFSKEYGLDTIMDIGFGITNAIFKNRRCNLSVTLGGFLIRFESAHEPSRITTPRFAAALSVRIGRHSIMHVEPANEILGLHYLPRPISYVPAEILAEAVQMHLMGLVIDEYNNNLVVGDKTETETSLGLYKTDPEHFSFQGKNHKHLHTHTDHNQQLRIIAYPVRIHIPPPSSFTPSSSSSSSFSSPHSDPRCWIPEIATWDSISVCLPVWNRDLKHMVPSSAHYYREWIATTLPSDSTKQQRLELGVKLVNQVRRDWKVNGVSVSSSTLPTLLKLYPPLLCLYRSIVTRCHKQLANDSVALNIKLKCVDGLLVQHLRWLSSEIATGIYPALSPLLHRRFGSSSTSNPRPVGLVMNRVECEEKDAAEKVSELFGFTVPLSRDDANEFERLRSHSIVEYDAIDLRSNHFRYFSLCQLLSRLRLSIHLTPAECRHCMTEWDEEVKSALQQPDPFLLAVFIAAFSLANDSCSNCACLLTTPPTSIRKKLWQAVQTCWPDEAERVRYGVTEAAVRMCCGWLAPSYNNNKTPLSIYQNCKFELTLNYGLAEPHHFCIVGDCELLTNDYETVGETERERIEATEKEEKNDPNFVLHQKSSAQLKSGKQSDSDQSCSRVVSSIHKSIITHSLCLSLFSLALALSLSLTVLVFRNY